MAIQFDDKNIETQARELAELMEVSIDDAVRAAIADQIVKARRTRERFAALSKLQEELASHPKTGLQADKAFFDELGGDL